MSAKELRKQAWNALNGNWKTMALISLAYVGICLSVAVLICFVGSFLELIIAPPLVLGLYMCTLKVLRKQELKVSNLFDGIGYFWKAVALNLVNSIFITLWSLLLIVPGIIKSYAYSMSYYILADNPDMTQSEARDESIRIMEGNKWRLFCLELSFIGWWLLIPLTFGILYFWVIPYVTTARAAFYEQIKPKKVVYVPIEELEGQNS